MNFSPPLSAQAQQAREIYASSALEYNVFVLFRIDYIVFYIALFFYLY